MFGLDTDFTVTQQAQRVLLIEHDESFARAITGMLEQASDTVSNVTVVSSLEEGLQRLAAEGFGIVILEFFLPDGAGLLNISLLKQQSPLVPVIVIGTVDDEAIALESVHAGAQDYLAKGQVSSRMLARSIRYTRERHETDVALLAAEEKYRGIFDHLMEGIFQTTPEGHYLMANAALARIYGYNSPEELKLSVTDIGRRLYVVPGRRDEFRRTMDEHDTISGFESQIFRKDGSIIWISENCRAIRDASGRLIYYEGTVEDITARRQAEQNLRDSEALYHSLVDTMPQNVFRKDVNGRFTFANQQYCKHYNCRLEDILGKTDFDFFPRELAHKYQRDDQRVMATGKSYETAEDHQPLGQERTVAQVVKTPLYDMNGTLIGLQGIFWDVTAQKLAEERVREAQEQVRKSEALYHSLVDTMPQCIFRKDMDGRYTFANKQFCRMVGKSLDELLGKTIFDILPETLAAVRKDNDAKVMASSTVLESVEENSFPGHENEFIHVLKIPICDAKGEVTGLQGMFWDITDLKLAEQRIRRANEELAASQEKLRLKNLQMEDDLKMASEIQLAMLPQQQPAFPRGVAAADNAFQFTHRYQPSGTVGGDFFTVNGISDTEAAVFICDVAGHGVRSALVTAMIRALVEEMRPFAHDPGQFMTKLNADLHAILKHAGTPVLTTAFYLVADCVTGRMRYANAGHPKPLLVRRADNRVETLNNASRKSQPALALFEKGNYQTSEVMLVPQDLVMLFTDGLYEVPNAHQELFTQEMLAAATRNHIALPAAKMFDELISGIRAYSGTGQFDDDVCVVGIEYTRSAISKVG